ncbi:lysozyme [Eoetvoesiella caeni]|uniref:Lysozyme n=1 Tax=Eoetvoesiella caeni TaxID=645616 RepID=A0A366HBV8_9BURK|nr:lysozyme [Eoetvoesiella caeni]MCI2809402.1 lysozyme [Eoetvoesiella caeni]NYT54543.1 lysozyme [Eoetvoesiella caeni]RBP39267.1 lysozyme [Eoetvoesiella caeni]
MDARTKVAAGAAAIAVSALVGLEGYTGGPYLDSAGVLTDCYGNTKNVRRDLVRSQAQCQALLNSEALRIGNHILSLTTRPVSTQTLASYISFTYNVGDSAFRASTLLKLHNQGRYREACEQMRRWVYVTVAGIKIRLQGLVNRRDKEVALCLSGLN